VARVAACERTSVLNPVLFHQPAADFFLVSGRLVSHGGDGFARPHVFLGLAMAAQAPLHLERDRLPRERHAVHPPVAAFAADPLIDVDAVIEIHEIGQIVHGIEAPVRKLARTGSSVGLVFQICEWQFMQVLVGGMLAKLELSTVVWQ
jgi:hypothetical protein